MKLDTDRIVAVSAMVVGVTGVLIAVYQAVLTREAQHASVLPYLTISINSNNEGVHVIVSNVGIGPALIEDARIRFKGREITDNPFEFFLTQYPDAERRDLTVESVLPGQLLPAGASRRVVGNEKYDEVFFGRILQLFEIAEVPKRWLENTGALNTQKAVIEVTYASVYKERWRARSNNTVPERLK